MGIRLRQIDADGMGRDRVAAGAKIDPTTGAVGSKASPAFRGLALPDRRTSADCSVQSALQCVSETPCGAVEMESDKRRFHIGLHQMACQAVFVVAVLAFGNL